MARIPCIPAFLSVAVTAISALTASAAVFEPLSVPPAAPVCLIGLGSGDGSPPWSEFDVTASGSIDLDLAGGAGLTVACGTPAAPAFRPAAGPANAADPSAKGDFGSL